MYYLILNYKTYPQATGNNAEVLTEIVARKQKGRSNVEIIVCPQISDLYRLKLNFPDLIMWAQHADPLPPNRNTGWITPYAIKKAGGSGTLINHSEHKLVSEMIAYTVDSVNEEKLEGCLLFPDSSVVIDLERSHNDAGIEGPFMMPAFAGYEPPNLIGGDYSPLDDPQNYKMTQDALQILQRYQTTPILGAGIKDPKDVSGALDMGFAGVLLASGFVKNKNPEKFLDQLLSAFPT